VSASRRFDAAADGPSGGAGPLADTDPPLGEREALTMAYVDDELEPGARRRFEAMMADDPELAAEVAAHRVMLDLGHSSGQLEPSEREVRRFWSRFYNRAEWRAGWILLGGGLAVLGTVGCYELIQVTGLSWIVKGAVLSILVGGGLLLWSTCRQRIRTRRFDRYRGVTR
jgi:hypothetical protein